MLARPHTWAPTQRLADWSPTALPWDEVFSFSWAQVASSGILDSPGLSPPVTPPVTCIHSFSPAQVIYTLHPLSLHRDDKEGQLTDAALAFTSVFWFTDAQSRSNRWYARTGDSRLISRASSLRCKKRGSQSGDVLDEGSQDFSCMLAIKQHWKWRIMQLGSVLPNKTGRWKCTLIQASLESSNCLSFSFHTLTSQTHVQHMYYPTESQSTAMSV